MKNIDKGKKGKKKINKDPLFHLHSAVHMRGLKGYMLQAFKYNTENISQSLCNHKLTMSRCDIKDSRAQKRMMKKARCSLPL